MTIQAKAQFFVVVAVLMSICRCITSKDLNYVASYIQNLQDAGHETIFSLFNLSRYASSKELEKQQSKLIKQCYLAKVKNKPMPIGNGLTEVQAKILIVNGYKILTEKGLRSAYNWILDEAHPQFMENFRAQSKSKARGIFYAPSILSLLASMGFSFVIFDFLRIYLSYHTEKKKQKTTGLTKKQRKMQAKNPVNPILDIKEMYIYKGYKIFYSMVSRLKGKEAALKTE